MRAPAATAWTMIWLSKMKSSELRSNGRAASSGRLKARRPVWYSDSFWASTMFSARVRTRLAMNLWRGMPSATASWARMREPSTRSYTP